jgi:hypothetical protein
MDEFDIELDSDIGTSVSKIKKYSNESEFDYDKVMEILNNSETINTHENVNEKSKDFLEYEPYQAKLDKLNTLSTTKYEPASFESKDSKTSMLLNNLSKTQIVYEPYQAKLDTLSTTKYKPGEQNCKTSSYPTNKFTSIQTVRNLEDTVFNSRPKKEINMNKFVKNIEYNIDNIDPLPANFTKNMINQNINLETFNPVPSIETIKIQPTEKQIEEISLYTKIVNWKYFDIILYILIFILLNNKFIIEIIYDKIPYMKTSESSYPNLIIRSLIFGMLIFLIKKFNL